MPRILACILFCAFATLARAQPLAAQNEFTVTDGQVTSAIVTVDVDRLFSQSRFGERIGLEYNEGREALALENRRIANALRNEELALAAQRPDMDPDVFRQEAEAFDDKAQGIRRAQDAKERELEETLTVGRDQFLEAARPILGQLMVDRGASAILDRRSVLLSLGSIDVTEIALERIDDALGDGMESAPSATPEN
ncbi:OmpH family outer membrane protein [Octadecabacter sp. G9-8]|uniref:OmpH family outer membrane protein n=1 Tax=Octadecabacter dasysiphoniae TaxID=2909341 RepID=A0ABS9CUH3_9RHOB|nr:OmpH family outer membrane protein [Octadecabacter dasysiphoniae]MCF2870581.1 OmpH family outer membrane protein [Octadecabacter dasysiphoniae]